MPPEKTWLDYLASIGAFLTPLLVLVLSGIGWRFKKAIERRHDLEEKITATPTTILLSICIIHALIYIGTYLFFLITHHFYDAFPLLGLFTGSFPFLLLIPLFQLGAKRKNEFLFVFNMFLAITWIATAGTCYYFAYMIFKCGNNIHGEGGLVGLFLIVPQIISSLILVFIIAVSYLISAFVPMKNTL